MAYGQDWEQLNYLNTITINICIDKFEAYSLKDEIIISQNWTLKLIPTAKDALKIIFDQYATNDDGTMSIADMKKYIDTCNGYSYINIHIWISIYVFWGVALSDLPP